MLSTLGADMETFRSRRMKELRVAVNPLVEERLKQMAGAGLGAAGTPSLSGKVRTPQPPCGCEQIVFSIPLICTGGRRIPTTASTYQVD